MEKTHRLLPVWLEPLREIRILTLHHKVRFNRDSFLAKKTTIFLLRYYNQKNNVRVVRGMKGLLHCPFFFFKLSSSLLHDLPKNVDTLLLCTTMNGFFFFIGRCIFIRSLCPYCNQTLYTSRCTVATDFFYFFPFFYYDRISDGQSQWGGKMVGPQCYFYNT